MMAHIFGYGEDFLTLLAVTKNLGYILHELGDCSSVDECKVFYRPSFGRRGLYGEFDAIVVTTSAAYLIESKWDNLSDLSGDLKLSKNQLDRHRIIEWIKTRWKGDDWNTFRKSMDDEFKSEFPGKQLPSSDSILGHNLVTVLKEIGDRRLENVLLYFYRKQKPKSPQPEFKLILFRYVTGPSKYIDMDTELLSPDN